MNRKEKLFKKFAFAIFLAGIVPISGADAAKYIVSQSNSATHSRQKNCQCSKSNCCKNSVKKYKILTGPSAVSTTPTHDYYIADNNKTDNYYNIKKDTGDKNFYVALGPGMYLWSFTNDYKSDYAGANSISGSDDYSFEPVWGGYLAVGMNLDKQLRTDLELGTTSKFTDSDDIAKFDMSAAYAMANIYYDFDSGLYIGGGVGVTRISETMSIAPTQDLKTTGKKVSWSPKLGIALGYNIKLSNSISLDLRYRLSGMKAGKILQTFWWDEVPGTYNQYSLQTDTGIVLENALSAGIRFSF